MDDHLQYHPVMQKKKSAQSIDQRGNTRSVTYSKDLELGSRGINFQAL